MKIHIMGASCSGVTSLGLYLSNVCNIPYFDTDEYFWEQSDPPFTVRRDPEKRNEMVYEQLKQQEVWLLGGSVINWQLFVRFDLVVFLWIPGEIRIQRLKERELERYGNIIYTDAERNRQFNEFINWASGYDDNTARGRTLAAHEEWISKLDCPVLELRGDMTIAERADKVLKKITQLQKAEELHS